MTGPTVLRLGLCSPAPGCGKSTVAAHLQHAHDFRVVPFAGPLKRMVTALLIEAGYSKDGAWHHLTEAKHRRLELLPGQPTARRLLQLAGTEFGRNLIHPDLWVELWKRQAVCHLAAGLNAVVDDVRFPGSPQRSGPWAALSSTSTAPMWSPIRRC